MDAYVLTRMELAGDGEQAHVVTRNCGLTFDPATAQDWAKQGVDFDFETHAVPDESILPGATAQLAKSIQDVRDMAADYGRKSDEVTRLIQELR